MTHNIYVDSYASLLEVKFDHDSVGTYNLSQADTIINPKCGSYFNKTVIINLPEDIPLEDLLPNNQVYSRFPIGYGIPVIPYEMPVNRKEVELDDYSCLILQPFMLTDMKYAKLVNNTNFLVGLKEQLDGSPTLVGMKILDTVIENHC